MAACEAVSAGGTRDGAGEITGSRCGEASATGRGAGRLGSLVCERGPPAGARPTRLGDHARPGTHAARSPRGREPTRLGARARTAQSRAESALGGGQAPLAGAAAAPSPAASGQVRLPPLAPGSRLPTAFLQERLGSDRHTD